MKPILMGKVFLVAAVISLTACSTIATYDQTAYEHATDLKVDTLALMKKANTPYASNQQAIASVQLEMDKAIEYDKGRPLNSDTVALWGILQDKFNQYLADWKAGSTLSPTFITDKTVGASGNTGMSADFDQIIELESGKNKPDTTGK